LKLRGKIDRRFPIGNLLGNLVADSFDLAQFAAFGGKDLLRFLENLEQLPQPNRPNSRQHIERDASFGRIHFLQPVILIPQSREKNL